jgi:hypothetical protein
MFCRTPRRVQPLDSRAFGAPFEQIIYSASQSRLVPKEADMIASATIDESPNYVRPDPTSEYIPVPKHQATHGSRNSACVSCTIAFQQMKQKPAPKRGGFGENTVCLSGQGLKSANMFHPCYERSGSIRNTPQGFNVFYVFNMITLQRHEPAFLFNTSWAVFD